MELVSIFTLLEHSLLIPIQLSFVEWSRLERIFATGLIARHQPINIKARSDVSADQGNAEAMPVQIDLPIPAEEH